MNDSMMSRRSFLKGTAVLAAMIPISGLLSACASDGGSANSDNSGSEQAASEQQSSSTSAATSSILVAYYSAQGHTESVAQAIADELSADTFVITPAEPYTTDELNYNNDDSRVSTEHLDENRHVELETIAPDNFDLYTTVFVGYPIWWGEASWVLDDFVSENDFSGKVVIPFCTSASSPLGDSGALLADMAGTGEWQEGIRFQSSVDETEVREWVSGLEL